MSPTEHILESLVQRVRRVRTWLVATTVLKSAAVTLGFLAAYIGAYALIDHWLHIGTAGRMAAFAVFVAATVALAIFVARKLYRHVSCSCAANFIESRMSFDQQLVAVVEYHETRDDYAYSPALAEHLVRQVEHSSRGMNFVDAVSKTRVAMLAAVVFGGAMIAGLFVQTHSAFLARYLSRLIHPLTTVAPLPTTVLTAVTGDLVAGVDEIVAPTASVDGRVPKVCELQVASTNREQPYAKNIPAAPTADANGQTLLKPEVILPRGEYRYRFAAGDAATEWRKITVAELPALKNMKATVSFPQNPKRAAYTCDVAKGELAVPKGAHVAIRAEATMAMTELSAVDEADATLPVTMTESREVAFEFDVPKEKKVTLAATTMQPAMTHALAPLTVTVKANSPTTFELASPEGDYEVTDVASVPIVFELRDEEGLASAELCVEIGGVPAVTRSATIGADATTGQVEATLELEEYALSVGDSVLYYVRAKDASGEGDDATTTSEIYFLEIAPYERIWPGKKTPQAVRRTDTPGIPKLPRAAGESHDQPADVLEYTRAFVKKTWLIAQKSTLSEADRGQLASIGRDVTYASQQLLEIRNDADYRWNEAQQMQLDEMRAIYDALAGQLTRGEAKPAFEKGKEAYQSLRKFLQDMYRCMPPEGSAAPKERPDRVKMTEPMHLTRCDSQRIAWELKTLADMIDAVRAKQEQLKLSFDHFMKKAAEEKSASLRVDGEVTNDIVQQACRKCKPGEQCAADGEMTRRVSVEGDVSRSTQPANGQAGRLPQDDEKQKKDAAAQQAQSGQMQTAQAQQAQAQSQQAQSEKAQSGQAQSATAAEQMQLLGARQQQLRNELAAIMEKMAALAEMESRQANAENRARAANGRAGQPLNEAMDQMQQSAKRVDEAAYQSPEQQKESLAAASAAMNKAIGKMDEAQSAVGQHAGTSEAEQRSSDARQVAEALSKIASQYDASVSKEEQQKMLSSLEQARQWLESASPSDASSQANRPAENVTSFQETLGGPVANDGNTVFRDDLPPPERARLLAMRFWSISIDAKKERATVADDDPSDAEFHASEKRYFENAAKFGATKGQP